MEAMEATGHTQGAFLLAVDAEAVFLLAVDMAGMVGCRLEGRTEAATACRLVVDMEAMDTTAPRRAVLWVVLPLVLRWVLVQASLVVLLSRMP